MELPVLTIFVPEKREIIQIQEGSGCKMDSKDIKDHNIDYLDYTQYSLDDMMESDGGQIMFKYILRDKHKSLMELVQQVLEFAYDDYKNTEINFVLLSEGDYIPKYIKEQSKTYSAYTKLVLDKKESRQ